MNNGDWFMLGCCVGFSPVVICFTLFTWLVGRNPVTIFIPGERGKDFTGRRDES